LEGKQQTAMIQADRHWRTLKAATGVVQGYSTAEPKRTSLRDETSSFKINKAPPGGREAVNLAVGFASTHSVMSTQRWGALRNVFRVPFAEWLAGAGRHFPDPDLIAEGIVPSNPPSPARSRSKGERHLTSVGISPPCSIADNCRSRTSGVAALSFVESVWIREQTIPLAHNRIVGLNHLFPCSSSYDSSPFIVLPSGEQSLVLEGLSGKRHRRLEALLSSHIRSECILQCSRAERRRACNAPFVTLFSISNCS
jgi:hypothetical protein